ncbi:hypothetical protein [Nitratireductor sp. OM-1]|uniref:hypothetical protein n=1 Tax=Nitratireductor sp. OM-1 TaxID=1756988 RepID=UPI000DE153A0|nr:hypothetical protein [Nitratireductor sp. OM-1]
MTDRVLIGAHDSTHVFRASRPGFDVKSTALSPEQLAFDSRWPEIGNILMRGTFQISGNGSKEVFFATTYDSPPMVIVHMSGPNNDLSSWYLVDGACWYDFNVRVDLYKYKFWVVKRDSNNIGSSQRTFRYTVLRNFYA